MPMKMKRFTRIAAAASGAALALLLAGAGILALARASLAASLDDQQAAERWNGAATAQLSCFYEEGAGFAPGRVYALERSLDGAMTSASLDGEGGRLWYHAYSAETSLYALTARASATLTVTVFGGDYFYIHRPALVAGGYLSPGGGNAGYAFLDEAAAWQLFGATDVVGMSVTIGGAEYTVCGVGRAPSSTPYDEAYGDAPRAYILFDSVAGADVPEALVYEAVLPNPIDGFAAGTLKKALSPDEKTTVTVENSARFSASALWEQLKERERLGVRTSRVTFPWWENVARVAEYRAASMFAAELGLLGAAALIVLVWIGIIWKPAGDALRRGARAARDGIEDGYNRLTRPRPKKEKKKKQTKQPPAAENVSAMPENASAAADGAGEPGKGENR